MQDFGTKPGSAVAFHYQAKPPARRGGWRVLMVAATVFFASSAGAQQSDNSQQSDDTANAREPLPVEAGWSYFAIDAAEVFGDFQAEHEISEPLDQSIWYQVETDPHFILPANCEAYLWHPQERAAGYRGSRIIGRRPAGQAVDGSVICLQRDLDAPRMTVTAKLPMHIDAETSSDDIVRDFYQAKI